MGAWRRRLATLVPLSTPESATGLGPLGKVRLWERPHGNDNYLTREMGFRVARRHAGKLARFSLLAGAVAPALSLLAAAAVWQWSAWLPLLLATTAALLQALGILVERWLFFAEAQHAVMAYY
jgi:DMSO reductase anchor subunit